MFSDLLRRSRQNLQSPAGFICLPETGLADVATRRLFESSQRFASSWTHLWGPAGIGKSHVIRHVVHREQRLNSGFNTLFTTATDLVALLPSDESAPHFPRGTFPDILICEDLDRLPDDPFLRGGLARCLEYAVEHRTRILATSHLSPGQLTNFPDRFINRLQGGLSIGMNGPGLESLCLLAGRWADDCGLRLQSEHIDLLVRRDGMTPRRLKSLMFSLAEAIHCGKIRCSPAEIQRFMKQHESSLRVSLVSVAEQVAREFGVTVEGLRSSSRQYGLALPRQCAMTLCRELTEETLTEIGRFFQRSHTSVSTSSNRLNNLLKDNPVVREQISRIRVQLLQECAERCA